MLVKISPNDSRNISEDSTILNYSDLYKLKLNLPDGTTEESRRWITKNGVTLKEVGFITGDEGKIHFYSEFSNVKMFKQDERLFEVPEGFKLAPVEDLDDVNELLKTMVKRG